MSQARFDPSNAVTFDLTHGLVHLEGAPARLLVPAGALDELCGAAGPSATAALGRAMGEAMGRRVRQRLGGLMEAAVERVVDHLGGELALAGMGALSLERWGQALVLLVDQSPLGARGDALVAAALAGALVAATDRPVRALLLARDGVRARFLIGGEAGVEKVDEWLGQGTSWGDALVRLHGRSPPLGVPPLPAASVPVPPLPVPPLPVPHEPPGSVRPPTLPSPPSGGET